MDQVEGMEESQKQQQQVCGPNASEDKNTKDNDDDNNEDNSTIENNQEEEEVEEEKNNDEDDGEGEEEEEEELNETTGEDKDSAQDTTQESDVEETETFDLETSNNDVDNDDDDDEHEQDNNINALEDCSNDNTSLNNSEEETQKQATTTEESESMDVDNAQQLEGDENEKEHDNSRGSATDGKEQEEQVEAEEESTTTTNLLESDNQSKVQEKTRQSSSPTAAATTTTVVITEEEEENKDEEESGEKDKASTSKDNNEKGQTTSSTNESTTLMETDEIEEQVAEREETSELVAENEAQSSSNNDKEGGGGGDAQEILNTNNKDSTNKDSNKESTDKTSSSEDLVNLDEEQDETDICKINSTISVGNLGEDDGVVVDDNDESAAAGTDAPLQTDDKGDSDDEMPTIRVKQFGLFAEESDDEDEAMDQTVNPNEIQNMMHVGTSSMGDSTSKTTDTEDSSISTRPRRKAAAVAANVIREISNQEGNDKESDRRRSKDGYDETNSTAVTPQTVERHRCHICKKMTVCKITVQQFGQDILLCSTNCFNIFRNPDPTRRPLPCAKCGILQNVVSTYYWETMNFCSELCIGNYQMEIGAKCATCTKKVAWQSLGKYCVRFGSDVRQFCTASCLESYKKNARVCFHCQLDIKKLSNVILANIPSKQTPKEFCSQDCVEMYIEQNLHQTVRTKPNQVSNCYVCTQFKNTYRELVLPNVTMKVCSENCWLKLLEVKNIKNAAKCEICAKYLNLELGTLKPAFYVATEKKIHGFCSATCKNVFVLRNREILACTTCKVKKYNYDLIRHVNETNSPFFAVCSLNCIPKPSQYIINLRDTLTPAATASEMFNLSKSRLLQEKQQQSNATPSRIRTTIMSDPNTEKSNETNDSGALRISSIASLANNNNNNNQEDVIEIYEGVENGHSIDTQITDEEMEELLANAEQFLVFPPKELVEKKNKGCLVRPYTTSVGIQTNADSLNDLNSLSLEEGEEEEEETTDTADSTKKSTIKKTIPKIITSSILKKSDGVVKEKYIPIFIPYFVPFPFYGFDSPVPVPFPVPIPVPIPVPVILNTDSKSSSSTSSSSNTTTTTTTTTRNTTAPVNSITTTTVGIPCNIPTGTTTTHTNEQHHHRQQQQQHQPHYQQQQQQQHHHHHHHHQQQQQQHHHHHQGLQPQPIPAMRTTLDKDTSGNSAGEIPESMRLDSVDSVNFLDLTGPNVGEADSFDILNTIPNLDMDLDFDGTAHSMHHVGAHPMMNQQMPLMQSVMEGNLQWQQQQQPLLMPPMGMSVPIPPMPKYTREEYALKCWKQYFGNESDPWNINVKHLGDKLAEWVDKGRNPNGVRFKPGEVLYVCLGIQEYLRRGNRPDKIFYDPPYLPFINAFTSYAESSFGQVPVEKSLDEHNFWESAELGVNGPEVLLFTLIYFNYKYFNLRTWQEHSNLMFNQIVVTMKTGPTGHKTKFMTIRGLGPKEEIPELDPSTPAIQQCPIRIFEFYKYKSMSDQGAFYKSVIPNVSSKAKWFTTNPLGQMEIYQMLIRAMMIKG